MSPHHLITFLYGTVGICSFFAYAPQVYSLVKSTGRSEAISIPAWTMFTYTNTIGFLYALIVVGDAPLILVNGLGAVGAALILSFTVYNRHYRFSPSLPKGVSTEAAQQLHLNLETK